MPEVLERHLDPDPKELPAAARTLMKNTGPLNWPIRTLKTVMRHEDTFMVTDPTKLKKAAHDQSYAWVAARSPSYQLGFIASWEGSAFKQARVLDPIGIPVELYVNYEPNANDMKRKKDEPEWAWERRMTRVKADAEQREADYNDGVSYLAKDYVFSGVGAKKRFDSWLEAWSNIINPKVEEEQAA